MKKSQRKTIHMSISDVFEKNVKEVSEFKGLNKTDTIKFGFDRYYFDIFRKEKYGYQRGILPAKLQTGIVQKNKKIEEIINTILTENDGQKIIDLLHFSGGIGYIQPEWEEDGSKYAIRTDQTTGIKYFSQLYPNNGGFEDRFTIEELANNVKKFLKSIKNN